MTFKIILPMVALQLMAIGSSHADTVDFPSDSECNSVYSQYSENATTEALSALNVVYNSLIMRSVLNYVSDGDSLLSSLENEFGETQLIRRLENARTKLDKDQKKYWSGYVDYDANVHAEQENETIKQYSLSQDSEYKLRACILSSLYVSDRLASMKLDGLFQAPSASGRVGYFDVSVESCKLGKTVGTGNSFTEPDQWDGSQFVVVDARFKNTDTEGRLPFEGDLIIKTPDGKELRYDTAETITESGYGIYFNSVNPYVTMPAKIVYRIPSDIQGEILWEPGRNETTTRLFCGFVSDPA